jgi:uncharacterized protein YcgL (UPF0745 family)
MIKFKQIIVGMVILLLSAGILYGADLQKGFLGTNWGADISELTGLNKISQEGDVSYYENPQKSYTLFGIDTANVIFGFFRDKFFAAYIAVESIKTFSRAKDHLTQKFGSPITILKTQNQQTIFMWKYDSIKIKLKLYEKEGEMKLAFYNGPLAAEANEVQREVFPQIPADAFSIDDRTRQEDINDIKLQRKMDVFGF